MDDIYQVFLVHYYTPSQWPTLLKSPTTHQPDPHLWSASVIELFSFIFPLSLVSLWLNVFYLFLQGVRKRKKEGGMSRRRQEGSAVQAVVMKGVFYSFTLPVCPVFSRLRRLIKRAWIVDVILSVSPPPPPPLFLVSHPHIPPSFPPSLSILTVLYLPATAGIHLPFTLSQCCSVTSDKRPQERKLSWTVDIKSSVLDFLYIVFTLYVGYCKYTHWPVY